MLPRMPDPIEIVPYDAGWPGWFAQVGAGLRDVLGDTAVRIDHVGSTAVPGLDAKPVLDIQISVAALEPSDRYAMPLERLGYVFHADNPERTKRYFREPPGTARTHLHVAEPAASRSSCRCCSATSCAPILTWPSSTPS
jgi:GrpB-like predicted nucleotidyltransferase (UPF0157 family)